MIGDQLGDTVLGALKIAFVPRGCGGVDPQPRLAILHQRVVGRKASLEVSVRYADQNEIIEVEKGNVEQLRLESNVCDSIAKNSVRSRARGSMPNEQRMTWTLGRPNFNLHSSRPLRLESAAGKTKPTN